jgi:DNA replication and repair protein RecF
VRAEVDRVLRQRGALLKQVSGRLDETAGLTLDVWDAKLAEAGAELARLRAALCERLVPLLADAYAAVAVGADARGRVEARYERSWSGELDEALAAGRTEDLRRGANLVGPHRDELVLSVGGLPARTHASQGEQRSLALALRLAAHSVVTATIGSAPILLLDDVFSELDSGRADALVAALPAGQTLLTSAAGLPPGAAPEKVMRVEAAAAPDGSGVVSRLVDDG